MTALRHSRLTLAILGTTLGLFTTILPVAHGEGQLPSTVFTRLFLRVTNDVDGRLLLGFVTTNTTSLTNGTVNPNQFNTGGAQLNIKSGAYVTNLNHVGQLLSDNLQATNITVTGTNFAAYLVGRGTGVTNVLPSALSGDYVYSIILGTNFSSAVDGQVLALYGDRTRWITASGGGGQATNVLSGAGAPSSTPGFNTGFYIDTSTGNLWHWYDSGWH